MNLSSPEFIESLKRRDHAAFDLLISEYQMPLYKAALKLKLNFDQAEEVVQQTWTSFFEGVEKFEGRSHIRTYLFGILYNKIKELWRSNKKYTAYFEDSELDKIFNEAGHHIEQPRSPDAWLENQQLGEILSESLDCLPENQKLAFFLKEVQGESTEDICKIMGISVTNLGVLIYRAKNKLRLQLENRLKE
ncbi:MAG: hypothetical protein CME62_01380 [Halobacteriovoraceae bacterium]|nr:hypothetical protein [Halobacteriovoraceae bacterium]|tara:strand:+ start:23925 stop:24497 length:573 start_codon:yes stop_codon:yes gene_type:complete